MAMYSLLHDRHDARRVPMERGRVALYSFNQMTLERAFEIGLPFFLKHCTVCCPVNISYQDELAFMQTFQVDLMHWRHVSITTTPCWGSRLVALRARVVLEEHWRFQPLSQCAGPGRTGSMACRVGPLAACLAMAHVTVPRLTPNTRGRPSVTSYA